MRKNMNIDTSQRKNPILVIFPSFFSHLREIKGGLRGEDVYFFLSESFLM